MGGAHLFDPFTHAQPRALWNTCEYPWLLLGWSPGWDRVLPSASPSPQSLPFGHWALLSLTMSLRIQPLCFIFPLTCPRAASETQEYRTGQLHCLMAELVTESLIASLPCSDRGDTSSGYCLSPLPSSNLPLPSSSIISWAR